VSGGALVTVRGAQLVDGKLLPAGSGFTEPRRRRFLQAEPIRLVEGERFLLATRMHWFIPLRGVSGMGVMWPLVFSLNVLVERLLGDVWFVKDVIWLAALAHSAITGFRLMQWRTDVLVVTNRRLVQTSGVFTHTVRETMLHQVRRLELYQSFFGQVFRFGTLHIALSGPHMGEGLKVGAEVLKEFARWVPHPGEVSYAAHAWMNRAEA
jgi:hypothetical protein